MITAEDKKALSAITEISFDEPMSAHTTFRVGGCAEAFASPSEEELAGLLSYTSSRGINTTVIGNGSNVLVSDEGIDGLVIAISKNIGGITVSDRSITCGAGELLSLLSRRAAASGLAGLEFAAGIPGSVGGAVVMNAGAYGGQISDLIKRVRILTPDLDICTLDREELMLSYRHSVFMEDEHKGDIILSVEMELVPGNESEIVSVMEDYNARRREKQPLEFPSAGSTFKRPEGYFAGALIEQSGLSGYRCGGAMVSDKHCGFVVNTGGATASDIMAVIEHVRAVVYEHTGVTLEKEVRLLGF